MKYINLFENYLKLKPGALYLEYEDSWSQDYVFLPIGNKSICIGAIMKSKKIFNNSDNPNIRSINFNNNLRFLNEDEKNIVYDYYFSHPQDVITIKLNSGINLTKSIDYKKFLIKKDMKKYNI